jgi:hypothetical protein
LIPRPQVHHCFREKSADVWILWIFFPHFAHGIGISAIQSAAIFRLRVSVTFCEGTDQRPLDRRCVPGILLSELKFLPRKLRCGRWNGDRINMRAARERYAPVRHRTFGIDLRGLLKRADRRAVIESVKKSEPLIEISLSFG